MQVLADIIRGGNAFLGLLVIPVLYFRVRHMKDTRYVPFKIAVAGLCLGIANGSYYAIGRPINSGVVIIFIALLSLLIITGIDDLKRRWGLSDCSDD